MRSRKIQKPLLALLVVTSLVAFYVGYNSDFAVALPPSTVASCASPQATAAATTAAQEFHGGEAEAFVVELKLPAVDRAGQGALADLVVGLTPGTGQVFVSIDSQSPLINPDTQTSLRTALEVAKNLAGTSLLNKNIYYTIKTDSDVVGGKSAGAAISVATLAALKGKKLREGVLVTGGVDEEGRVTPVGKVYEKALALKAQGYREFVVPAGEGTQRIPREECTEKRTGGSVFRECTTVTETVSVEDETGIKVTEVDTIEQAFEVMVK